MDEEYFWDGWLIIKILAVSMCSFLKVVFENFLSKFRSSFTLSPRSILALLLRKNKQACSHTLFNCFCTAAKAQIVRKKFRKDRITKSVDAWEPLHKL